MRESSLCTKGEDIKMNNKVRMLALAITAIILLSLVPITAGAAANSGTCGNNLMWTLDNGLLTISGTGDMRDYGIGVFVSPPWSDYYVERVEIKSGVTSIGEYAFFECALESIEIPDTVKSIGEEAFLYCVALEKISVSESNKYYSSDGSALFNKDKTTLLFYALGKSDTSYTIPNTVTSISSFAFYGCQKLETLDIPAAVKSIGDDAFEDTGIENINVSLSNRYYSSKDGVLFNKNKTTLMFYPRGKRNISYTVPNGVTTIGANAFRYCYVETLILPSSIKSIGNYVFYDAYIEYFEIPTSVTSVGNFAFDWGDPTVYYGGTEAQWKKIIFADALDDPEFNTSNFKNIYYNSKAPEQTYSGSCGNNLKWSFDNGVLTISGVGTMTDWDNAWDAPWGSIRAYVDTVKIEDGVATIGAGAFFNMIHLKSVSIPSSVTSIGRIAFSGCTRLSSVNIPHDVTTIGDRAFYKCTSLTSVSLPNGVWSIGDGVFYGCASLTSARLSERITKLGKEMFYGCTRLASVNIPGSITAIGENAFRDCKSLTRASISHGVTSIEDSAFCNCTSLTSVSLPSSIRSIGNNTFRNCTSLTSVSLPSSIRSIGNSTFRGCQGLTSMNIPLGIVSIDNYAFYDCTGLTDVYYEGDEDDLALVSIGSNNEPLTEAEIHYTPTKFAGMPTVSAQDGAYTVSARVKALDGCVVVAALMDGRKTIDVEAVTLAEGETEAEATVSGNAKTVQVFIWDSLENMKPLCPPRTITIE